MMTDQTNDETTDEQIDVLDQPGVNEPSEVKEGQRGDDVATAARSEAAKYRVRAREAEAERDQLTAQLEGLRREMVQGALASKLHKPATLWSFLPDGAAQFFTEDGSLDAATLESRATELIREHGLATPKRFQGSHDQGVRESHHKPAATWSGLLNQ